MKKFFIDLGGHDGCSIKKFKEEYDIDNEYYCYSFEANKTYCSFFENFENHTFINKAAHTYDGNIEMNIDRKQGFGSSIIKEKKDRKPGQLDRDNPDTVECIDFSKWINNNFDKDDYIIVKMDIEGSEYDILEKMIKDGTLTHINKLFIEWHYHKVNIENIEERHNTLLEKLKNYNLIIDDTWCAIKYSSTFNK